LFQLLYKLVIQNDTRKSIFRLRDKYIEVNPSEWKEKADTSVVVGLGNGSREQEMMQLNQIFQVQQQLAANPTFNTIVGKTNVFNTVEDMVKVFNKASAGRYFTDPMSPEAQQAAQQQQEQQKAMQAEMSAKEQAAMQMEQQRLALEGKKASSKAQYDDRMATVAEGKLQQSAVEHEDDITIKTAELEKEYELEKEQGRGVALG